MTLARPYHLVNAYLKNITKLSPHMHRFTFTGEDIALIKTFAPDQRIKIFFPNQFGEEPALENTAEWYNVYRAIPEIKRPAMRTYTIRQLRADDREVDIDFAMHGCTGPASTWAENAKVGDKVQIAAPNAAFDGDAGGYEWRPPQHPKHILLVADETALPALAGILEELSAKPNFTAVTALIEVPSQADIIPVIVHEKIKTTWLARDISQTVLPGTLLIAEVERLFQKGGRFSNLTIRNTDNIFLADIDIDENILWEVSNSETNQAPRVPFYAWVAGESAAVLKIRKLLIKDFGIDKSMLNLMGYWRKGKVFD